MILCLLVSSSTMHTIVDHFVTILSTYFPNARKSRVDAKTFVNLGNAVSRHGVSPYMIYRAKLGKGYAEIDYMYTHFPRTTFDSLGCWKMQRLEEMEKWLVGGRCKNPDDPLAQRGTTLANAGVKTSLGRQGMEEKRGGRKREKARDTNRCQLSYGRPATTSDYEGYCLREYTN